MKLKGL